MMRLPVETICRYQVIDTLELNADHNDIELVYKKQ
jgi:hypothetical protein